MVLQLKNERQGPVWMQIQWPSKRRTIQLVMPIPRGGARAEGGLAVAGVANQKECRAISQGYVVVGPMEEKLPWVAEGNVEEVCAGNRCFMVLWHKLYGQHRMSRRQHKMITWESHQQNQELGIKFAAEASTCKAQGLPEVVWGITRVGAPFSVWPNKEQDKVARAAAKRARKIIMVTARETGIATIRQRGADPIAGRSGEDGARAVQSRLRSQRAGRRCSWTRAGEAGPVGGHQPKDDTAAVPTAATVISTEEYANQPHTLHSTWAATHLRTHQQSLDDLSFSVFNIHSASGLGGALLVIVILLLATLSYSLAR